MAKSRNFLFSLSTFGAFRVKIAFSSWPLKSPLARDCGLFTIKQARSTSMNMYRLFSPQCRRLVVLVVAACCLNLGPHGVARGQQKLDGFERDRSLIMLKNVKDQIKKNYYDPTFHGMDIEERFKTAEEKVKAATSLGQIYG